MDTQDWLTRHGQAQAIKARAMQHQRLTRARVYAAYVNLSKTEAWDIFMTDLIEGVLLRPCQHDVDRGRQHLVVEILHHLALALHGQQLPVEGLPELVLGGVER